MAKNQPNRAELASYLSGSGDVVVRNRCEELLSRADGQICEMAAELTNTPSNDSLLSALKQKPVGEFDNPAISDLTEQIETMIPRHAITAEELSRVLDSSELPDSIGRIGRFEVAEFLAGGGMGIVFRCLDLQLEREVCVKLLNPIHEFNTEAKIRFERESREMAKMNCERIVTVFEVGCQKDLPYFVMPLLPGNSLRTLLGRVGKLPVDQSLRIVRQLAEGLDYAQRYGLLHRDIKPDNLWVLPGGDLKILDFGLAYVEHESAPITRSGTVLGTPSYMSPEQISGNPLDQRSDLFGVGVVWVEMLTGKSPFQKANLFATMMSVASDTLTIESLDPEGNIPAALQEIVLALLEKDTEKRTKSAAILIDQLNAAECGQAVPNLGLEEASSESGNLFGNGV